MAILITNKVLSVSYQSICHVRLQPENGEEGGDKKTRCSHKHFNLAPVKLFE